MKTPSTLNKLQALYDSEINFQIDCFWDDGFHWMIGDHMNGYLDAGEQYTVEAAIDDMWEAALRAHPRLGKLR